MSDSDSNPQDKSAVSGETSIQFFSVGVGKLVFKFLRKGLGWLMIYFWGYWGFSPGYLLAPLFYSVLRSEKELHW